MNLKKIIWAIIEIVTIGIGLGMVVENVAGSYARADETMIGCILFATGVIMITWRKDFFSNA